MRIKSSLETRLIGQSRAVDEFTIVDFRNPVGAATSIPNRDARHPGKRGFSAENGWYCDRLAAGDKTRSLGGGNSNAGSAVATGAAADENYVKIFGAIFLNDFAKWAKQQGVVAAVAGETPLDHNPSVNRQRDGRGVGGGFEDQDGRHGSRLTRNGIYGS